MKLRTSKARLLAFGFLGLSALGMTSWWMLALRAKEAEPSSESSVVLRHEGDRLVIPELIAAALQANPDLQAAEAALRAARENVLAQHGAYFPSVDAHLNATRQSVAGTLASPTASDSDLFNLHTVQLNISYVPDVFGGNRRQVESLTAQAEAQRFSARRST